MRSLILAAILVMVNASPVDPALQERAATANLCSKVKNVVTNGGYQSIATKFCSSYLSIPAGSTTTSTVTRPTNTIVMTTVTVSTRTVQGPATSTTVITTITNTVTNTEAETETTMDTSTSTVNLIGKCTAPPGAPGYPAKKKRNASVGKPPCFSTYTSGAVLSSACKCLSIPQGTSIVTSTSYTTSTSTSTVSATATETSTPISTVTSTTTTDTTTVTTVTTTTGTVTTVTSTSIGPPANFPSPFKLYGNDQQPRFGIVNQNQGIYSSSFSGGGLFRLQGTDLVSSFAFDPNTPLIGVVNQVQDLSYFYFFRAASITGDVTKIMCSTGFDGQYCRLYCQFADTNHNKQSLAGNQWYIGNYVPNGLNAFTPIIVDPNV